MSSLTLTGTYHFDEALRRINEGGERFLDEWGNTVSGDARRVAPVDTGELRDSQAYGLVGGGDAVEVRSDAPYSSIVNFGGVRQAAQPFFSQAVENGRANAEAIAQKAFRE